MDRARIVGLVDLQNNDNDEGRNETDSQNDTSSIRNIHFVLEFRADGSVVGQIPRVISALSLSGAANNDSSTIRLAPGRFGQLWRKRQSCWLNFAHPQLAGMALSPGHEVVWRTMDRARIVGFVDL